MKSPKIGKITFALVDVKGGRKALNKIVADHKKRLPITLTGFIVSPWGGDDGTSIEFEMQVTKQFVGPVMEQRCNCIRCIPRPRPDVAKLKPSKKPRWECPGKGA